MNQGKFFKADNDTIFDKDNGIYIFRYLELFDNSKVSDVERYPIYLVFKNSTIEFNFIGTMLEGEKTQFGNFRLITIPISQFKNNDTSREIIKCYNRKLVYSFNTQFKWKKIIDKPYSRNYDLDKQGELKDNFYKKILLDFVEDLYHSQVFYKSTLFNRIKEYLDGCNIFKGIYLKHDYLQKKEFIDNNDDKQITKAFVEAGISYVEYITQIENFEYFSKQTYEDNWLDIAELELQKVINYRKFRELSSKELEKKEKKEFEKEVSNWLVKNYEITKAFVFFYTSLSEPYKRIFTIVIPLVSFFIIISTLLSFNYNVLPSLFYIITLLSLLFGFVIAAFSIYKPYIINILMPRLQMALLTSWIAFLSTLDFWKYRFDTLFISEGLPGGILLLLACCLYIFYEVRRNTKMESRAYILRKISNIIGFGFILSLFIGLIGMSFFTKNYFTHSDFLETKIVREHIQALESYDSTKDNLEKSIKFYSLLLERPKHSKNGDSLKSMNLKKENLFYWNKRLLKLEQDSFFTNKNLIFAKIDTFSLSKSNSKVLYRFQLPFQFNLYLFPGFLFLTAAFALFSGIFLTLLFDDKPITDPL
jgi:hypothetical protein